MLSQKISRMALLAITLGLTACGSETQAPSETKIINGSAASATGILASSTIALADRSGNVFCTGTLISKRLVVSAGHCLISYSGTLYLGFGSNSSNFKFVRASRYAAHPNFTGRFTQAAPADISIVELSQDAPQGFNPVAIYNGALNAGDALYLAGFGQTETGSAGSLAYTRVAVRSQTGTEIQVGATGSYTGSCYGDSGGPAYVYDGQKLSVIGATSRGVPGCKGDSTYTNVASYANWISSWSGSRI